MAYKVQINDEVRDATLDEAAAIDAQRAEAAAQAAALDARNAALQSAHTKLAALGLTADEIAALLGR
jgi:hypothetical protein